MTSTALRKWAWVHKWTSLICTVFMLLLCLTGLPLIFYHEIGELTGLEAEVPEMPADTPKVSMDSLVSAAEAAYPGKVVQFFFQEDDEPNSWFVTLNDSLTADENAVHVVLDARTAEVLAKPKFDEGFMHVMFRLHVDLFAGLPGMLFLGFMGLLLVAAIISGVVLYAPFMRKLAFGTVRRTRSPRLKWLDMHNLLGIVTLTWALVVGATGVINTWAELMFKYWQFDQLAHMTAPYKDLPVPATPGSFENALNAARSHEPSLNPDFIAFPGTHFSSPHHFAIFMRGSEPFSSRLLKPVLVDSQSAEVTDSRTLPWYLTALLISQPLHFGDYGGMPMKVLWAALDILTIIVLGSGLYLWWQRREKVIEEVDEIILQGEPA